VDAKNLTTDKIWRLTNLYKIRTKERGIIKFRPNSIQWKIIEQVKNDKPIRHFTLKSRQVGISTLWLLWHLDDTLFHQGTITGVLAHKWEALEHLSSIIRIALQNLPRPIPMEEENRSKWTIKGLNSTIFVSLEIRSTTIHNLHISEWAFCEDDRIHATIGAASAHTNITGETTGNGVGNDAYQTWMDSKEGKNGYKNIFIPWYQHEEYKIPALGILEPEKSEKILGLSQDQINFRRTMRYRLKNQFYQEFPETEEDAFAQSSVSYFNSRKILTLAKEARVVNEQQPPIGKTDDYTIWESPVKGHTYVIGADVAEGVEGDFSAFKVRCLTCRQEAMAYHAHVGLDTYYRDLDHWGRRYGNALLGVERNNHGHAILLALVEQCAYPNLYCEDEPPRRIIQDSSKVNREKKYGWHTTANSKPLMLDALKLALEGDSLEDENNFEPSFTVRDLTMLDEILTFRQEGHKLEAISGKHDDTVIAAAICEMMAQEAKKRLNRKLTGVIIADERQARYNPDQKPYSISD
jgi:hypothetical protein